MSQIDYDVLYRPKPASAGGHSVENSFYLQKSAETAGRYREYHKIRTEGAKRTATGTKVLHGR